MNHLSVVQGAQGKLVFQRVFQLRSTKIPSTLVRYKSEGSGGSRPWDKSTRAVVYDLPDVLSPSDIKSRQTHGLNVDLPSAHEPKSDRKATKDRLAEAHFDLRFQNWERNQNNDFRSKMRQWDVQQQVFKTSRLIKHQEYGTFYSHRQNVSGRPGPSNSMPLGLYEVTHSDFSSDSKKLDDQSKETAQISAGKHGSH